jgi:hypothetical protein
MDMVNRPVRLRPLNPRRGRDLDTSGSGNFAQDGYRRLERSPRLAGFDPVSPQQADRIEEFSKAISTHYDE